MAADWTDKDVEHRVLEAAETLMRSPNTYAGGGGNGWPEYVPHYPREMKIRVRPTPAQISRMTETWSWINALESEKDRRLLYAWAWQKTKRGRFLNDFAAQEGINSRSLRRSITRICQAIADRLNQHSLAGQTPAVDAMSEKDAEIAPSTVSSQSRAAPLDTGRYGFTEVGFMKPGAKPRHDPQHPDFKKLVSRIERQNRRRKRA